MATPSLSDYFRILGGMGAAPAPVESLNDFSPDYISLYDYSLEPLAMPDTQYGRYIPELATSWTLGPGTVTVHLRKDANWQNGTPVTSKDVTTSLLLQGVDGSGIWSAITGYTTPNRHTVVLQVHKGVSPARVLYDVLTMYPVAAQRYGRFVAVPHLESDLLKYAALAATNPTAAQSSSEGKVISRTLSKLTAYNPKTYLGDGPYRFQKMNTQEVILQKWDGFWDSREIHVPGIISTLLASNSETWAAFLGGRGDIGQIALTGPILKKMRATPGLHVALEPLVGYLLGLFYNDRMSPFNQVGVRQALAYVLNRPEISKLVGGGNSSLYPATVYPDGVTDKVLEDAAPPGQLKSLSQYRYDPSKAATMLKKQGFHKKGNQWYLPDGKPFTMTIDTIAGDSDTIEFAVTAAKELTNFGIKAQTSALQSTTDFGDLEKGAFTASIVYIDGSEPMSTLITEFDQYDFTSAGSGFGFGPIKVVPGLGKVNLGKAVASEESTLGPGSKQLNKDLFIWAKYIDKQMPFLTAATRDIFMPYSSSRFTDWPAASNSMWKLENLDYTGMLMRMFEKGYVRPKS